MGLPQLKQFTVLLGVASRGSDGGNSQLQFKTNRIELRPLQRSKVLMCTSLVKTMLRGPNERASASSWACLENLMEKVLVEKAMED